MSKKTILVITIFFIVQTFVAGFCYKLPAEVLLYSHKNDFFVIPDEDNEREIIYVGSKLFLTSMKEKYEYVDSTVVNASLYYGDIIEGMQKLNKFTCYRKSLYKMMKVYDYNKNTDTMTIYIFYWC